MNYIYIEKDMKNIRIGNDIKIEWSLYDGGSAFILEGRDVKVYLKDKYGRREITDYVISGNMLTWTFHGKNQRRTGAYSLELVVNENENGMITTDACQFVNLVHCSCDVAGSDDNGVSTETIELRSQLSVGGSSGEGGGSYDDTAIWKAVNNKVDKEEGKGLSTNDYTDEEREKLAGLENYDDTELKEEIAETYASKEYVDEAVGNAGGGGEGCECATPDWSALEGEAGHILNRPCYYELSEMNIFETDVMVDSSYQTTMYGGDLFRVKVLGETFDIDLSGKEIPTYDYDHDIQNKLSYTFDIDTIRVSVDFYDAGDGTLTMEFGFVALEGESAPDELTLYVAEYVVNGRQRLSEGLIPQTIARKSELTELSAEVGKKVDSDFVNNAIATAITNELTADF